MIIFPAIDLRNGKAVRLVEGDFKQETVYAEDPAAVAEQFRDAGAEFLHVVDLDGALAGESRNTDVIRRILQKAGNMKVEVGGGIRDLHAVSRMLDMGVTRVILGSLAARNPVETREICKYFPGQAVAGIDAKNGEVGIEHIIFTDISRDGKLQGVNVEATAELAKASGVKVIASGGVASIEDVKKVMAREEDGIEGVIIGKAIYAGKVNLKEALAVAKGKG